MTAVANYPPTTFDTGSCYVPAFIILFFNSSHGASAWGVCSYSPRALEASLSVPANTATRDAFNLQPKKEWPLKFRSHSFSAHCYDTYGARVFYAGLQQRDDDPNQLRPSSASYGLDYRRNWSGTHSGIRNFPPPAEVSWRSKDGQAHDTTIDIGEIFRDQVIRHNVPREEVANMPTGNIKAIRRF